MPTITDQTKEARLRRLAHREGLALQKSRVRTPYSDDWGGYRLIEPNHNFIVHGPRFDLDLDDVEAFLTNFS